MIKGLSLDIWGTLLSNDQRTKPKMFGEYCQVLESISGKEIPFPIFSAAYRSADKFCDLVNLETNEDFGLRQRLKVAVNLMSCSEVSKPIGLTEQMIDDNFEKFFEIQNRVAVELPPRLIHDTIPDYLSFFSKNGIKIAIASNTGSYPASLMKEILKEQKIYSSIDFFGFSDEIYHVKPFPDFFEAISSGLDLKADEILHVGDNPIADVKGASSFGMRTALVDRNGSDEEKLEYLFNGLKSELEKKGYLK